MAFRTITLLFCVGLLWQTPAVAQAELPDLPSQISDHDFWKTISEFSEEGGYFPFENLVSNEDAFLTIVPRLQQVTAPDSVYIGVGPEQNFSYIDAVKPRIAFIVDIRRQNMLEHLLYKALFEMSSDRADFLSRLLSRPRPAGLNANSTVDDLFRRYRAIRSDSVRFDAGLKTVIDYLKGRGFAPTATDEKAVAYVFQAFFKRGPDLTYDYPGVHPDDGTISPPTFEELMTARDTDGVQQSFLASEKNFQFIRDMQRKNLIVPVVGDFSGEQAIRSIGEYLKPYRSMVGIFYTSNVEQYLFEQGDAWKRFYRNVAALPLNAGSTFVRSNSNWKSSVGARSRWITLTCPIPDLLNAFRRGQIDSYYDVFAMSK